MKIGLDIHGVIDSKPEFFSGLTHALKAGSWEVHIITGGSLKNGEIIKHLESMNVVYTHVFSVFDHLVENKAKTNEELGIASRWPFPDDTWNKVKSKYCEKHGIDMHIDDMQEYLEHFKTPFMSYKDKDRNHKGQFGEHDE